MRAQSVLVLPKETNLITNNNNNVLSQKFDSQTFFLTPQSDLIQLPKSTPLIQLDTEEKNDVAVILYCRQCKGSKLTTNATQNFKKKIGGKTN